MRLLFVFVFLSSVAIGQNKKKQIESLNKSLDSLNYVLEIERKSYNEQINKANQNLQEANNESTNKIKHLNDDKIFLKEQLLDKKTIIDSLFFVLQFERKQILKNIFSVKNITIDSSLFSNIKDEFLKNYKYLINVNSIIDLFCNLNINIPKFKIGENIILNSNGYVWEDGEEDETCGQTSTITFNKLKNTANKLVSVETEYSSGNGSDYTIDFYIYDTVRKSFKKLNFEKNYSCNSINYYDLDRDKLYGYKLYENILSINIGCCSNEFCADCCPNLNINLKYKIEDNKAIFIEFNNL